MWLLRSRIWIQSWLSCWRGPRGAPAQLTASQSLCIALVARHLRGLGEEDWGLERSFGHEEEELSCGTRSFCRLMRSSCDVCVG